MPGSSTIGAIEQNPKYSKHGPALQEYKKKIEEELFQDCENIISMISSDVMASLTEAEGKAFFQKMIGDYYRYMAENAQADRLTKAREGALSSYNEADKMGAEMPPCNPIKSIARIQFPWQCNAMQ